MATVSFIGLALIFLSSCAAPGGSTARPPAVVELGRQANADWALHGRPELRRHGKGEMPRGGQRDTEKKGTRKPGDGKMSSGDYSLTWYGEANTQDNGGRRIEKPWPVLPQRSSWCTHLRPSRRQLFESPLPLTPLQRRRRLLSPASGSSEVLVMLSRDYSHRPRSRPPVNNRQPLNHREVHRP